MFVVQKLLLSSKRFVWSILQLIRQTGKSSAEVTFKREEDAKAARANIHRWVSVLADLAISLSESFCLKDPCALSQLLPCRSRVERPLLLPPLKEMQGFIVLLLSSRFMFVIFVLQRECRSAYCISDHACLSAYRVVKLEGQELLVEY